MLDMDTFSLIYAMISTYFSSSEAWRTFIQRWLATLEILKKNCLFIILFKTFTLRLSVNAEICMKYSKKTRSVVFLSNKKKVPKIKLFRGPVKIKHIINLSAT